MGAVESANAGRALAGNPAASDDDFISPLYDVYSVASAAEMQHIHSSAQRSVNAFAENAADLSVFRPVFGCGGSTNVEANAFAVVHGPAGQVPVRLFPDTPPSSDELKLESPVLSWKLEEAFILESIRVAMAPGCCSVSANPVKLVPSHSLTTPTALLPIVSPSSTGSGTLLPLGHLFVVCDESAHISLSRTKYDERCDIRASEGSTGEGGISTGKRLIVWAACCNADDGVIQVTASPNALMIVYQLFAAPMLRAGHPDSGLKLENHPLVAAIKRLDESDPTAPIAYFTQFAYAHTEMYTFDCQNLLQLLRGCDYIVAAGAAELGLEVRAHPIWFRDRPNTDRLASLPPPSRSPHVFAPAVRQRYEIGDPIDRHPYVGAAFTWRKENGYTTMRELLDSDIDASRIRWLNAPHHVDAAALFSSEFVDTEVDHNYRLAASNAVALILSRKADLPLRTAESPPEAPLERNTIQSFQYALQEACRKSSWHCSGSLAVTAQHRMDLAFRTPDGNAHITSVPAQHRAYASASDVECAPTPSLEPLLSVLTPAAFGHGSESVLDPSYRRALALEADELAINWHPSRQGILNKIEAMMTPTMPPLRAVLGKVNVYRAGDFFKKHMDTPRHPRMVGSLVVCLPFAHQGGDLRLKHEGRTVTVSLANDGSADPSTGGKSMLRWCAMFSDVEHEVLPVTSGNRVTITYDLIADLLPLEVEVSGKMVPLHYGDEGQLAVLPRELRATYPASASLIKDSIATLQKILAETRGRWLGIFCSHAYPITPRGLVEHKLLKGVDALLWNALVIAGRAPILRAVHHCCYELQNGDLTHEKCQPELNTLPAKEDRSNYDEVHHEVHFVADGFMPFFESSGGETNAPPWDHEWDQQWQHAAGLRPSGKGACEKGVVWLNKPRRMMVGGTWDCMLGNWPMNQSVFYSTVAILIPVPLFKNRAWERRKHAVAFYATRTF